MGSIEFDEIAEIASRQSVGGYSAESDAITALLLIERLAKALADERRAT